MAIELYEAKQLVERDCDDCEEKIMHIKAVRTLGEFMPHEQAEMLTNLASGSVMRVMELVLAACGRDEALTNELAELVHDMVESALCEMNCESCDAQTKEKLENARRLVLRLAFNRLVETGITV